MHGSVLVCAEDLGADGLVAFQHVGRRVAEGVVASGADDRDTGRETVEEGSGARRQAPVVRHFEDPDTSRRELRGDGLLRLPADVPGQDDRHVAPAQFENDRIVVADVLPFPIRQRGMLDDHVDAVDREPIVRLDGRPARATRRRRAAQVAECRRTGHGDAFPHVTWPEVPDERCEAADVVGVAVRDGGRVEPADAVVAQ